MSHVIQALSFNCEKVSRIAIDLFVAHYSKKDIHIKTNYYYFLNTPLVILPHNFFLTRIT